MLGKKEVDRKLEEDKNGGMGEEGIRREGNGMRKGEGGGNGGGRGWACRKEGGWGKGMSDVGRGSGMGIGKGVWEQGRGLKPRWMEE